MPGYGIGDEIRGLRADVEQLKSELAFMRTTEKGRLRAINKELVTALEEWSLPYVDYVGFIESDIAKRLERTRTLIKRARP